MDFKVKPAQWIAFVFAFFYFSAALAANPSKSEKALHWTTVAKHVGHTEKSREAALKELQKIPHLDQALLKALKNHQRPLALDVISAMKMDHLIPDLLEQISEDEDGFLVLTVNSLLTETNKDLIFSTYLNKLEKDQAQEMPAAALVAMLEPLGRVGHEVPSMSLKKLLHHDFPEVRSAVLYYARLMSLKGKSESFSSLIVDATHLSPFQLRLQAYSAVEELAVADRKKAPFPAKDLRSQCEKEKHSYVKTRCQEVLKLLKGA